MENTDTPAAVEPVDPKKNAENALGILESAASAYRGTRRDHELIMAAAHLLRQLIEEHHKTEAPSKE